LPARGAHGQDQCRFVVVLTCFVQSKEVFCEARKFPAKFDVFRLKRFMLGPRFDVNRTLQVETDGMHNFFAVGPDLHDGDHVKLLDKLASFRVELPSIRRILLSLVNDHVKHGSDHVKLCVELPCSHEITSNFGRNFLAQTRSSCDSGFAFITCNVSWKRLDLHWSQNSPVVGFCVRTRNL